MSQELAPTYLSHSNSRRRAGFGEALRQTAHDLASNRWYVVQTFRRDFASQTSFTRGGAFWNYVLPLVPVGAYVLLMAMRLFPSFGAVNGVVYITMGVTLWFLFAGLVRAPITLLEKQFTALAKSNTPIIPAIVASIAQLAFETLLRLGLVIVVFAVFQGVPSWRVIFAVPMIAVACLLFFSIGLVLGLFNLAYRDLSKIVGIFLTYGLFFSGVIFPMGSGAIITRILAFNPFYVFIENIRRCSVGEPVIYLWSIAAFAVAAVVIFLIAIRFAYRAELRLRGWV
ncbi:ABC transporter permease [Hyphococcus sp.]|jgi:lipopolysaccharide transport system permease protein|uniref:ABC transporter permease n=1 Tax=Hyphococcus sp. TaxID=2038636 RepID=UPI003D0F1F81